MRIRGVGGYKSPDLSLVGAMLLEYRSALMRVHAFELAQNSDEALERECRPWPRAVASASGCGRNRDNEKT